MPIASGIWALVVGLTYTCHDAWHSEGLHYALIVASACHSRWQQLKFCPLFVTRRDSVMVLAERVNAVYWRKINYRRKRRRREGSWE